MKQYPIKKLYEEMEFIAYYNHWDYETLMNMEHRERAKWCQQISKINQNINGEKENKNIFEFNKEKLKIKCERKMRNIFSKYKK